MRYVNSDLPGKQIPDMLDSSGMLSLGFYLSKSNLFFFKPGPSPLVKDINYQHCYRGVPF